MIGGNVLKVIEHTDKLTLVVRGSGMEHGEVVHVYVELGSDVEASDSVWWQGGEVFVTRGSNFEFVFRDKPCKKIGYSFGHYYLEGHAG